MSVDKSRNPYFDDYNEDKNFHEVLFVPRRAVQVRELNQIQSMFQKQIERFGNHVFVDGSVVIPGEHNFDLDFSFARVVIPDIINIGSMLNGPNITIRGESGITANVKLFVAPENSDPSTFYLEYMDSSVDGEQNVFNDGELLDIFDGETNIGEAEVLTTGIGSKFTINNGVYYLGGKFVLVEEQTILLEKYGNTPSVIVGLEYAERIVTENEDSSLFDNAQGSPNFTAPGAHRLRVDTNLAVVPFDQLDNLPENFAEIVRFKDGNILRRFSDPSYNILNDVMAQRTYEESGDYTVKNFSVSFDQDTNPDKYKVNLGKGLAYVNGYRVETLSTIPLITDRARERGLINNSSLSASLGYYILVEDLNVLPNLNQLQQITFYDNAVVDPGVQPTGAALGTANVRLVRKDGTDYRLHIFNVRDMSGNRTTTFISDAVSVYSSVGAPALSANLVSSEIFNATENSLMYPLNVEYVATLLDGQGNSDTSYSSVRQFNSNADSNGVVTLSAPTNEIFVNQDTSSFGLATFTDIIEFVSLDGKVSLGGNPTGSTIIIDFGIGNAGRPVRLNLQVAKQEIKQKVKTPTTTTTSGSLTGGKLSLNKADAYEIVSVLDDNGVNITSQFKLVENKTQSFYDVSYIETTATVAEPITVQFRFFSHSAGDYFSVDSYSGIPYDDIPTENGIRLSDILDFRPRINDAGTGFTGSGSIVGNIPTPFTIIRADVDHYLPRLDKVYVSREGEFGIIKGVPALDPKYPEDPSNVMVIYKLEIPAYTFSHEDVQAIRVSNRRYTMKDIGKLDDRIGNLEYYVTLNLLEKEAEARDIVDPVTGLNRFKNGFLTDSFVDHSVGDFTWEGYHVSTSDEGELRPEFSLYATDLEMNETDSENFVVNNGIVTLPFTEQTLIRQNYRSTTINVNPYAIYRWIGDLQLTPQIDTWIDTVYKDPDVTYRVFNNGRLTQQWNSWQVNWTGGTKTQKSQSSIQSSRARLAAAGIAFRGGWMTRGQIVTTTTTTTRTNVDIVADRVVDTSVIPYMRSIDVHIRGNGSRPQTRMHFFFDGVNINQYVRPNTLVDFGTPVLCNSAGNFNAIFRIPNNNQRRFRTGDKLLTVTDNPNNQLEFATSYSEATFTSSGVLNTRQRTIIATRQVTTTTSSRYVHRDPIAQSFVVEQAGGAFVTKINVFFSTKDPNVPVQIELREMENGIPTQRMIPGGLKSLMPSEVNISNNGSVATTFEFPYPVHLAGGEYCFVLVSNSNLYNAHIATMGQRDKGTRNLIAEQPYSGVMFKSQNNSTWTEDQNSDIQFEIFAAQFNTNVVGKIVLENTDLVNIQLDLNPIETIQGSSTIIINRFMHNYVETGKIELSGCVGGNGISASELNKIHTVTNIISPYQFEVQLSETATDSGVIGGSDVFISDTIQASVINPSIRYVQLPDTGIEYYARGTSGKSIDGTENPYQISSVFKPITNGEVNLLSQPWLVTNRMDESQNMSNQRSMRIEALMATTNPNVSPVIDLEGSNVIMPFAMVTYPEVVEADGSNNHANYRTNITGLRNPANSIRVLIDALRPIGSDVIISARFANSRDEIDQSSWTVLNSIIESSEGDSFAFMENEYGLENLNDFTVYQLMIQLKAKNAADVPIMKRLRVIALGT